MKEKLGELSEMMNGNPKLIESDVWICKTENRNGTKIVRMISGGFCVLLFVILCFEESFRRPPRLSFANYNCPFRLIPRFFFPFLVHKLKVSNFFFLIHFFAVTLIKIYYFLLKNDSGFEQEMSDER